MPSKEELLEIVKNKKYFKSRLEITCQIWKVDDINTLFSALNDNSHITHLELSVCFSGVEGARAVANGLVHNTTIRVLRLKENNIGDEGAKLLANAILRNKTLKSLYLSFNNIEEEGVRYLYNAACQNRNIINIDLNFDHPGEKIIRPLLEENKLLRKKLTLNFLTKALTTAAAHHLRNSPAIEHVPSMFDLVPHIADFLYGHGIFREEKFWQKLQNKELKLEHKELIMR